MCGRTVQGQAGRARYIQGWPGIARGAPLEAPGAVVMWRHVLVRVRFRVQIRVRNRFMHGSGHGSMFWRTRHVLMHEACSDAH